MPDFSKIEEKIYLGSLPDSVETLKRALEGDKVDAILSVTEAPLSDSDEVEMYLWVPVVDRHGALLEQLRKAVSFITSVVEQDKTIYVHCRYGMGRAPMMLAAYYISKGMSVQESLDFLASKRSIAHPNENQVTALQAFKNELQA